MIPFHYLYFACLIGVVIGSGFSTSLYYVHFKQMEQYLERQSGEFAKSQREITRYLEKIHGKEY